MYRTTLKVTLAVVVPPNQRRPSNDRVINSIWDALNKQLPMKNGAGVTLALMSVESNEADDDL